MREVRKKLDKQFTAIEASSRDELVAQWIKIYKHPPPKGAKRGLLERAAAHRIQIRRFGGLKSETRKSLLMIACGADCNIQHSSVSLKPGTRLLREWHGRPYQVNVTETGFDWDGNKYTSLSAIAKAITGAKWSGPRFFGL